MIKSIVQTGLVLLFILSSLDASSQLNINTNPFWLGEIQMLDGSIKSGFVQPPNIAAQRKISFKPSEKEAVQKIKRQEIAKIKVISENDKAYYFDNLPIGSHKKVSKKRYLLLVQARNNFVTFYIMSTYKVNNTTGNITALTKGDLPSFSYWMSKGAKTDAKMYYMSGQASGIKKDAEWHFAEDPNLVERMKNKELKGNDIPEIIRTFLKKTESM